MPSLESNKQAFDCFVIFDITIQRFWLRHPHLFSFFSFDLLLDRFSSWLTILIRHDHMAHFYIFGIQSEGLFRISDSRCFEYRLRFANELFVFTNEITFDNSDAFSWSGNNMLPDANDRILMFFWVKIELPGLRRLLSRRKALTQ